MKPRGRSQRVALFERCIIPSRSRSSGDSSATTPISSQPLPSQPTQDRRDSNDASARIEDILVDGPDCVHDEVQEDGYDNATYISFATSTVIPDPCKYHPPPADLNDGEGERDNATNDADGTWYVKCL